MIKFESIELFTLMEVAQILELEVQTIRKIVSKGMLPSRKIGRRIYVQAEALRAYLQPIPWGNF